MVLPSNSSPKIYPDNKTSNFKIQLSERVELHNKWEVALLEINYPNTIEQVSDGENAIDILYSDGKKDTFLLRPGHYITKENLLFALHETLTPLEELPSGNGRSSVVELTENGYIMFHPFNRAPDAKYSFSPRLAIQLGLLHSGPYLTNEELLGTYPVDTSLGVTPQLYVYLDIIEDQIVGHTRVPLLRTIPVETRKSYGGMTTYRCDPPIYFKLKTKSFDTLEVNIRTHTGKFTPFDHGTSTLLCHFRQCA